MSKQLDVYGMDLVAGIPLGRKGAPGDMAGPCILWASRAGAWITGTTLQVDGGALVGGTPMTKQAKL